MAILTKTGNSVSADSESEKRTWQQQLKSATRDANSLLRQLGLPERTVQIGGAQQFPVFAPEAFIARMKPGDVDDPLLRQVLPLLEEDSSPEHFTQDPLREDLARLRPGLIQKYSGRALLISTGVCAIHCRYCFRRHFPYKDAPKSVDAWRQAFDCLIDDPNIEEVLLSGGDPLTLVDHQLCQLIEELEKIPHLKRIRIHSRLPVVIPDRVTDELVANLANSRLQTIFVIHANHANELDKNVEQSVAKLRAACPIILNQAVLLRGVNNHANTQIDLCQRLIEINVLPYYLHQLDPVVGAAHFEVPIPDGIELIREIRTQLPGYAVPRYVQELAGEPGKTILA